jgi:hypothetical protein
VTWWRSLSNKEANTVMLEPLHDLPDGVIGFEAVGEVHANDYTEMLRPPLDEAAAAGGIRLVYVLGDRFAGYSAGASWQDSKLAFEHHKAWKRTALVSDADWVRHLASLFGWMVPGDFAHFSLAERDDAIAWAAAAANDD